MSLKTTSKYALSNPKKYGKIKSGYLTNHYVPYPLLLRIKVWR